MVSTPPGITCPQDCSGTFDDGAQVSLVAQTPPGSEFIGFQGPGCSPGKASCTVSVDGGVVVTARTQPWLRIQLQRPASSAYPTRLAVLGIAPACEADCSVIAAGPQTVRLLLGRHDGLDRWTGACADAGFTDECVLNVDGPTTVGAEVSLANRAYFVGPVAPATFGGDLAAADAYCAESLNTAGTYRAWLMMPDAGVTGAARLGGARGWVVEDGPFADSVESLEQGRVFRSAPWPGSPSISILATGGLGATAEANCDGWRSTSGTFAGGTSGAAGVHWAQAPELIGDCATAQAAIYCFGVDKVQYVRPAREPGARLAFLSSPWRPGSGLVGADGRCNAEARVHGLVGNFLAYLGTSTREAAARFSPSSHVRLDGVSADDWMPLNVTADGGYLVLGGDVDAGTFAWTGDQTANCADWRSVEGSGRVGRPEYGGGQRVRAGTAPCDTAQRLYCLANGP